MERHFALVFANVNDYGYGVNFFDVPEFNKLWVYGDGVPFFCEGHVWTIWVGAFQFGLVL